MLISSFSIGLTSSPYRPTKKLNMTEEKKIASRSRPKEPNLSEDVRSSSNLRRSSHRLAHQFDFSNIVDDPIEVEEVEDPSEDSDQGLAFGEEALSEDDSQDISSAPYETETTNNSLDERATTVGEGQFEHTSRPTPSPVCSSPLSFSCIFLFPYFIFSIFLAHRD